MDKTKSLTLGGSEWINYKYVFKNLFLESGEGETKREKNIDWLLLAHHQLGTWPVTQADEESNRGPFPW